MAYTKPQHLTAYTFRNSAQGHPTQPVPSIPANVQVPKQGPISIQPVATPVRASVPNQGVNAGELGKPWASMF